MLATGKSFTCKIHVQPDRVVPERRSAGNCVALSLEFNSVRVSFCRKFIVISVENCQRPEATCSYGSINLSELEIRNILEQKEEFANIMLFPLSTNQSIVNIEIRGNTFAIYPCQA